MSYSLNKKIRDLKPYDPIQGDFRIRLDANESFLPLSDAIKAEVNQVLLKVAFNRYPDPLCSDLCSAFADYYGIDKSLVTAGNGSDELISVIVNSFAMKGDKVITVEPDFSMYRFYAELSETECIAVPKRKDLSIDIEDVIKVCNTSGARIIIFSNPCNPTSLGVRREEIIQLIHSVNALVVLDEAYMDFWDQSLLQQVNEFDNLIILRTSSKAVGSAAIRLGFAVANPILSNALRAVKSPYNVNSLTQAIGTCVFSHKKDLQNALSQILVSRDILYRAIKQIESDFPNRIIVYPTCTNFVFIKPKVKGEAKKMFAYFLQNSVAIRFMGDYLRITAGTAAENEEAVKLMRDYLTCN